MPVPNGMGQPNLDYNGCYYGLFFAIETKTPGKLPTPQQEATIRRIRAAGGKVFLIDGDPAGLGDTTELEEWLNKVSRLGPILASHLGP